MIAINLGIKRINDRQSCFAPNTPRNPGNFLGFKPYIIASLPQQILAPQQSTPHDLHS